jgi:hypothetical protein
MLHEEYTQARDRPRVRMASPRDRGLATLKTTQSDSSSSQRSTCSHTGFSTGILNEKERLNLTAAAAPPPPD